MIERVRFQNYKALHDVEIEFGRLTVLVGANACGKSSVLEGIDGFLAEMRDGGTGEEFAHISAYEKRTLNSDTRQWTYEFALKSCLQISDEEQDEIGFDLGPENLALKLEVQDHGLRVDIFSELSFKFDDDPQFRPVDDEHRWEFEKRLELSQILKAEYLQLEPKRLISAAYAEQTPQFQPDGSYMIAVLAELALNDPRKLDRIRADLAKVVPGIGHYRFPRETVTRVEQETITVNGKSFTRSAEKQYPGYGLSVELDERGWIPARDLSEGTLLTLGLLTALHTSGANVIMFDDLDRGLHPRAQADLIRCLRRILEERPELQIICTTHSPFLLNHFTAEEVRVMGLDDQRHAHVRTLSEHPDWAEWKSTMQTGEFWSVVGDDWAGRVAD